MLGMRIFLLLLYIVEAVIQDPCALVAQRRTATYKEAILCYKNFRLLAQVKDATLDTLRKALPLMAPNFLVAAGLEKKLEHVQQKAYTTEFQFHMDMVRVFAEAKMGYDAGCFSSFRFHLPLGLDLHQEQGEPSIHVASVLSHGPELLEHWQQLGVDPLKYRGWRVEKINSVHAVKYVKRFAQHLGSSFNQALTRGVFSNGTWRIKSGGFSERRVPPGTGSFTFEFSANQKLEAPIIVSVPRGFVDSQSFYTNLCAPAGFPSPPPVIQGSVSPPFEHTPQVQPQEVRFTALATFDRTKAALAISRFTGTPAWERELLGALSYLRSANISELILDLRDSGGDYICGSYHLLGAFSSQLRFPMTFSNSGVLQKAMRQCMSPNSTCQSKPVFVKALTCGDSFLKDMPHAPIKRIAIVTNGICSGACAILVHGLQEIRTASTYFAGPQYDQAALGSSGIPYSLRQLMQELPHQQPLPTQADVRFTFGEFFKAQGRGVISLDRMAPRVLFSSDRPEAFLNPANLWNTILGVNGTIRFPRY